MASAKPLPRVSPRGTRIALGDIDDVSETSDLIGATGHPAVPVTPDVSDPPSTEAARDRVTDALGRVDIAAIPVSVQGLGICLDLLVWGN